MKILITFLCVGYFCCVESNDIDRKRLCESCLMAAKEIQRALQDAPTKNRQGVIKKLMQGAVCKNLPEDKRSSCMHFIGIHQDQFHESLSNKDPKQLDIVLCYEQSRTCVGVKRHTFKDPTPTSLESDIDALLLKNKEKVRFAKPIHSESTVHPKEEL